MPRPSSLSSGGIHAIRLRIRQGTASATAPSPSCSLSHTQIFTQAPPSSGFKPPSRGLYTSLAPRHPHGGLPSPESVSTWPNELKGSPRPASSAVVEGNLQGQSASSSLNEDFGSHQSTTRTQTSSEIATEATSQTLASDANPAPEFPLYRPSPIEQPHDFELDIPIPTSNKALLSALKELESEVKELESASSSSIKSRLTAEITSALPEEYTDEYLESVLHSLISSVPAPGELAVEQGRLGDGSFDHLAIDSGSDGNETTRIDFEGAVKKRRRSALTAGERGDLVSGLAERLVIEGPTGLPKDDGSTSASGSAHSMTTSIDGGKVSGKQIGNRAASSSNPGILALEALESLAFSAHTTSSAKPTSTDSTPAAIPTTVSSGVATHLEWQALFEDALVQQRDLAQAERILRIRAANGRDPSSASKESQDVLLLLSELANRGDPHAVESAVTRLSPFADIPAHASAHFMISSHLLSPTPDHISAIRILHAQESLSQPLPQATYDLVLTSLTRATPTISQQLKAISWDLYGHMRLVAHPQPSLSIYNTMINACADPFDPQPERALDLFTELVQEAKYEPGSDTYNAAILACARVKGFYTDAFRLFREMLTKHEARSQGIRESIRTGYEPSLDTFKALLEGTKRNGDLPRARWILAEMLKLVPYGGQRPNKDILTSVFHTYAAFKPPVTKSDFKIVKTASRDEAGETKIENEHEQKKGSTSSSDKITTAPNEGSSESIATGPQTSGEVLLEADRLFEFIVQSTSQADHISSPLRVHLTSRLVNSYISVYFAHAPLSACINLLDTIYTSLPSSTARMNGWTYLFLFERFNKATSNAEKRIVANALARYTSGYERWYKAAASELAGMEGTGAQRQKRAHSIGMGARQIEKVWIGMIRSYCL